MRFLKRIIVCVLIYMAVFLPCVLVAQAMTGYDFTAAYTVGGGFCAVELALTSVIKITENKHKINQNQENGVQYYDESQ